MKLLIGTPAFAGQITAQYEVSMAVTIKGLIASGVDFMFHSITNESLINRARNNIAARAVNENFDRLLFIDADIGWTWDDILLILNTKDKPVIGGLYPLKSFPINYNWNPLPQHLDVFETGETTDGIKNYRKGLRQVQTYRETYCAKDGTVQCLHVPTGFMAINVGVFKHLQPKVKSYSHRNNSVSKIERIWEYFPVGVRNDILESEDWAFCSLCRENGVPVFVHTDVLLTHTGTYTFDGKAGECVFVPTRASDGIARLEKEIARIKAEEDRLSWAKITRAVCDDDGSGCNELDWSGVLTRDNPFGFEPDEGDTALRLCAW